MLARLEFRNVERRGRRLFLFRRNVQFGADLGKLLEGLLVPGLAFLPVLHDLGGQLAHVFDEAFTLTLETLLHGLALFAVRCCSALSASSSPSRLAAKAFRRSITAVIS